MLKNVADFFCVSTLAHSNHVLRREDGINKLVDGPILRNDAVRGTWDADSDVVAVDRFSRVLRLAHPNSRIPILRFQHRQLQSTRRGSIGVYRSRNRYDQQDQQYRRNDRSEGLMHLVVWFYASD